MAAAYEGALIDLQLMDRNDPLTCAQDGCLGNPSEPFVPRWVLDRKEPFVVRLDGVVTLAGFFL